MNAHLEDEISTDETNLIETQDAGKEPEVTDYEVRMWAGKIPVYVCAHCGRQYDDLDRCVLHILGHYSKDEQEAVLDRLVKDK